MYVFLRLSLLFVGIRPVNKPHTTNRHGLFFGGPGVTWNKNVVLSIFSVEYEDLWGTWSNLE